VDDLLNKILTTAKLSEEEKSEFIVNFYNILILEIIKATEDNNPSFANNLKSAMEKFEVEPEYVKDIIEQAYSSTELKTEIDNAVKSVTENLVDLIEENASEEQKQEILSAVE
jgi:hypothetical protein